MSDFRMETRPQRNTDGVMPRFHLEPVKDHAASATAGRDIYVDEERVQIIIPGRGDAPVERVNDGHRGRWPEQYAAFKKGHDTALSGMPLEQWAQLSRSQVLELKFLGFQTVEQVAVMPDQAAQKIGTGGARLRSLAKAYLDDADSQAEQNRLLALSDRQAAENDQLRREVGELRAIVDRLHHESMARADRLPATETHVPMHHDPVAMATPIGRTEPAAESSLAGLPEPRRRPGRPTNAEIAARQGTPEAA